MADEFTLKLGRRTTELVFRALRRATIRAHGQEREVLFSVCMRMNDWLERPPPVPVQFTVTKLEEDEPCP